MFAGHAQASLAANAMKHSCEPYWVTQDWMRGVTAGAEKALDRLLPERFRRRRTRERMERGIDAIVVRNAENLRWSMLRGIDTTFQPSTTEFEARLDEAVAAAEGAVQAALDHRMRHAAPVESESAGLGCRCDLVTAAQERLTHETQRLPWS